MENSELESLPGRSRSQEHSKKWFENWKIITAIIIVIIAGIIGGISYYQATRFNSNVIINGTKVGGLTAEQALTKLKTSVLKNTVYAGEQQILDEPDTKLGFTNKDLPGIEKLVKDQWSFFPSSKAKTFTVIPKNADQYRSQTFKKLVEDKLTAMNQGLKPPTDAEAKVEQGQIIISKSIDGEQFDVASMLKDYKNQENSSEIHLKPVYLQPVREDSEIVKNEQKKLQELLQQAVTYKVQDKVYSLNANELVKTATVSKDMKVTFDTADLQNKITEINNAQSTLNKNFQFTTHSGAVISVKAQGYGWALDVSKETARIQEAFEKGEKEIPASNIYGKGWGKEAIGYDKTTNNGLGDTYAEVSIAEQQIWIYKNGQLAITTNVVTGRHNTGEDTHPGIWYILYKKAPSILKGTSVGHGGSYEVKVNYWAPFTNDGQGFHDASWRSNWAGNAYITNGSGGCVNTPPSIMKTVYDNLSTFEPVVIY